MLAHPNGGVEMTPHSYINGSTTSINRARSVSISALFWSKYARVFEIIKLQDLKSVHFFIQTLGKPESKWIWANHSFSIPPRSA